MNEPSPAVAPVIDLKTSLPKQFVVGKGQFLIIRARLRWQGHTNIKVSLISPQRALYGSAHENNAWVDNGYDLECFPNVDGLKDAMEFYMRIPWQPADIGSEQVIRLRVESSQNKNAELELGSIKLIADKQQAVAPANLMGDAPLVAICMATYCPKIDRLSRQIESILCQSYENWLLIISDDAFVSADTAGSLDKVEDQTDWAEIEALCAIDPRRIRLYRHENNLGFYHNFERALEYVPENAAYIAFADQDDVWYPDKLQKLVTSVNTQQSLLAYSDMRIVHDNGKVLAETYWQGRKNEYQDFDTVFLANTVTGAASLFKRELLSTLLPFPASIGDAFHDHWMACASLTAGKISYVDEPLYDYMQYGDSVIGHCDFKPWTMTARIKSVFRLLARLLRPKKAKAWLRQKIGGGLAIYQYECLRLQLTADTLKRRLPEQAQLPTLQLMNGGWRSVFALLKTHVKILKSGRTTDDAEFRLAMGSVARQYQKFKMK